jgi:hypothetical protein
MHPRVDNASTTHITMHPSWMLAETYNHFKVKQPLEHNAILLQFLGVQQLHPGLDAITRNGEEFSHSQHSKDAQYSFQKESSMPLNKLLQPHEVHHA